MSPRLDMCNFHSRCKAEHFSSMFPFLFIKYEQRYIKRVSKLLMGGALPIYVSQKKKNSNSQKAMKESKTPTVGKDC